MSDTSGARFLRDAPPGRSVMWPTDSSLHSLGILDIRSTEESGIPNSVNVLLGKSRGWLTKNELNKEKQQIANDRTKWDWRNILKKISTLETRVGDTSRICREINTYIQGQQPLWRCMQEIRRLANEIQQYKDSFLITNDKSFGLRHIRLLEQSAEHKAELTQSSMSSEMRFERKKEDLASILRFFFNDSEGEISAQRDGKKANKLLSLLRGAVINKKVGGARSTKEVFSSLLSNEEECIRSKRAETTSYFQTLLTDVVKRRVARHNSLIQDPYTIEKDTAGTSDDIYAYFFEEPDKQKMDARKAVLRSIFTLEEADTLIEKFDEQYNLGQVRKRRESIVSMHEGENLVQKYCDRIKVKRELDENLPLIEADVSILAEMIKKVKEMADAEEILFERLSVDFAFGAESPSLHMICAPGPCGESPIHTCFLLGLKDTSKRMIDRFYNRPELLNVAYGNDLHPWRGKSPHENPVGWEDGLYTGETCLHIAIVKEDIDLVQFLLDRGISLTSKATGAFFQPRLVRFHVQNLQLRKWLKHRYDSCNAEGRKLKFWEVLSAKFEGENQGFSFWQLLKAKLVSERTKSNLVSVCQVNEQSSCYYGEYPLSFAASIGNVQICELLYTYLKSQNCIPGDKNRQEMEEMIVTQLEQRDLSLRREPIRANQTAHDDQGSKPETEIHSVPAKRPGRAVWNFFMSIYVNAMDSFGNTAMHMAVIHGRKDVIDWLMSKYEGNENLGKESLEMLNFDGLTPLTLAARHGQVDIFRHILYNYLSEIVWGFGKVQMRVTDLFQVDTYRIQNDESEGMHSSVFSVWDVLKSCVTWNNKVAPQEFATGQDPDCGLHSSNHWRCAIEVIVQYEVNAFSKDPLFNKLIDQKWNNFACRVYIIRTVSIYALMLMWFASFVVVRSREVQHDWTLQNDGSGSAFPCNVDLAKYVNDLIASNDEIRGTRIASVVLEGTLAFIWGPVMLVTGWRHRKLKVTDLDINEDGTYDIVEIQEFFYKNLQFLLSAASGVILIMVGVCRFMCWETVELDLIAVSSVLLFSNMMNVLIPFRYVGALVITIYKMAMGDMARFMVVYFFLHCAFSFAFSLVCQRSDSVETLNGVDFPGFSFLRMAFVSLGDDLERLLSDIYMYTRIPGLTMSLYFVWMILSSVLMLNLIVAMMGKTFSDDTEHTHRIWVFPYASLVLNCERMLTKQQRKKYRYGTVASWGRSPDHDNLVPKDRNLQRVYEVSVAATADKTESDIEKLQRAHEEQHGKHQRTLESVMKGLKQASDVTAQIKAQRERAEGPEEPGHGFAASVRRETRELGGGVFEKERQGDDLKREK